MKNIRADIERYFQLLGHPRTVSNWKIIVSCINPRLLPMILLRVSAFFYKRNFGVVAKFFSLLNFLIFGIETSPKVKIGGGLFLAHTVGTILGAERIGENVTIMNGVTLGAKEADFHFTTNSRPLIGNNVFIGTGAKIIGPVTVGDFTKIGANSVVLEDVPDHSIAVGVPAKVIKKLPVLSTEI